MPTTTRIPAQRNPSLLRQTDIPGVHTTAGQRILLDACRQIIKVIGWDKLDTALAAIRARYTALNVAPSYLSETPPVVDNVVNPQVGKKLNVVLHSYDGIPAPVMTYQWQRGASTDIGSATSPQYIPQVADVGSTLKCKVTATNGVGSPLVQTTAATAAVIAA